METLIKNDAAVLGLLFLMLGIIFYTSSSSNKFLKGFYSVVPPVFLCYFIPGILNSLGVISGTDSALPNMASQYLLPVSLVLLTIGLDISSLRMLGGKAIIIFLAGTVGVILGGPFALLVCKFIFSDSFSATGVDEVWRGMSTIAGSWIGGSANQAAMNRMFEPSGPLFSSMIVVDVIIGNLLLAVLLFMAGKNAGINRFLKADTSSIETVKKRLESIRTEGMRIPSTKDLMMILGAGFASVGIAHLLANRIAPFIGSHYPEMASRLSLSSSFFWMVLIVSFIGILLSFTPLKKLEGAGASKIGSVFLYVLVATIGMNMDLRAVVNQPVFFLMGLIWIVFHILFTFGVAKLIKAPLFFVAVGSQANVGGAASAPVVAASFDPALAPVGALLAVLGYAIGTYGAYISALLMQAVY